MPFTQNHDDTREWPVAWNLIDDHMGKVTSSFWTGRVKTVRLGSRLHIAVFWSHYVCRWRIARHDCKLDLSSRKLYMGRSPVADLPAFGFGSHFYKQRNVEVAGRNYVVAEQNRSISLLRDTRDSSACILKLDHRFFGWRALFYAREFLLPEMITLEERVLVTALVIDQSTTFKG